MSWYLQIKLDTVEQLAVGGVSIIIVCKKYYTQVIRNELAGKSGKVSTDCTKTFSIHALSQHNHSL